MHVATIAIHLKAMHVAIICPRTPIATKITFMESSVWTLKLVPAV